MEKEKKKSPKEEYIKIHYKRKDGNYDDWCLWLWEFPQGIGKEYPFNGTDDFGVFAYYPLSCFSNSVFYNSIGVIVKSKGSWANKDGEADRKIRFPKLVKDENNVYNVYIVSNDGNVYSNENLKVFDLIKVAKFIDFRTISIEASDLFNSYKIFEDDILICEKNFDETIKKCIIEFEDGREIKFSHSYEVELTFSESKKTSKEFISPTRLYSSDKFVEKYSYDGELGAIYSKDSTTFKVWTPISTKVILKVYNSGTPCFIDKIRGSDKPIFEKEMIKDSNGVFSLKVDGDLEGKYYTYTVTNVVFKNREIVDPYAKSAGVNGLRGMIVDFSKTNPFGFNDIKIHSINPKHLTVYETHIADLTSSKTWSNDEKNRKLAKTFLGAALEGTTYEENGVTVKTGFDNIKELGVNAVQLLPIFDQANDEITKSFNWGYNPLNYNVLEGSYSTNPYDGYARIKEFKELVLKYNKAGINIIMDVVYNHVNGAPGSNFDTLMPGYYFRHNEDRTLSNGSGCGNETASDAPMFRKFMIDSVLFLAKEYKLGGFRFDLMGLHDIETMNLLVKKLKEFNPDIVVYGEPWCGGRSALDYRKACIQSNIAKFEDYGAFNDKGREAIPYWATATKVINEVSFTHLLSSIAGSLWYEDKGVSNPNKTLNYVSCHDNYTIFDRLNAMKIDPNDIPKIAMLMNSIIFTSNGISFMLAGEEFLRTKQGCENSYNASYKINELDYSLKIKNKLMFENFQKLIKFKQEVSDLALDEDKNLDIDIRISKNKNVLVYDLFDEKTNRIYRVAHANKFDEKSLGSVDFLEYTLYLDTLGEEKKLSMYTKIHPYETIIAYKQK